MWKWLTVVALTCVVAIGSARTAEKLNPVETLAFNNFHHEMVYCLSYYTIVIQMLKNRDEEKEAAKYKKVVDALTDRIIAVGSLLGMKDEAAFARMRMAAREHMQDIDNNFINASILLEKYAEPCKTVVENSDSRIEYWMNEAATKQ